MTSQSDTPSARTASRRSDWDGVDGKFAWVLVFTCGLTLFLQGGLIRSFSIIYKVLLEKYGRSDTITSWVPSIHGTIKLCSSPLTGVLIQRFDERRVALVGSVMAFFGLILTALSPNIQLVMLCYGLLHGLGSNAQIMAALSIVTKYFDKNRGKATSLLFCFVPLGALVLGPTMPLMFAEYGYLGAMLLLASLTFHTAISAALMRPLPKQPSPKNVESGDCAEAKNLEPKRTYSEGSQTHQAVEGLSLLEDNIGDIDKSTPECGESLLTEKADNDKTDTVIKEPPPGMCKRMARKIYDSFGFSLMANHMFASFCLLMAAATMVQDVRNSFYVTYIIEKQFSEVQVTLTIILSSAFDIPSRLIAGCFFDLRSLRAHRMTMSVVLFLCVGVLTIVFPITGSIPVFAISVLTVQSTFLAAVHSQHTNVAAVLVGQDNIPAGIGLIRFFQGVALLVASPLGGVLKDFTGTYGTVFILAGAFLALTASVFIVVRAAQRLCLAKNHA